MPENTEILSNTVAKENHSHIFSISIRGWVCIIVTLTVCGMSFLGKEVKEPLYTLVSMVIGYYFGQITKPKSQQIQ